MASTKVPSEIHAQVWKIEVASGDRVSEGDTLIILESMKMEIPVEAPRDGTVANILVKEGQEILEGETLLVLSH